MNVRPLRALNGVSVTQMAATFLQIQLQLLQSLHQPLTSLHLPFKLIIFLPLHYFLCLYSFKSSYKDTIFVPSFI